MSLSKRRSYLRKKINSWLFENKSKPKINKLTKEAYEVFKEFNLNAEDFISDACKIRRIIGSTQDRRLTNEQDAEYKKDQRRALYRYRMNRRINKTAGKLPDIDYSKLKKRGLA